MFDEGYLPPIFLLPSGLVVPSGITNPSGIFLFNIFGSTCNTVLILSGTGYPRIFEGINGIYFYSNPSGVLFSADDYEWLKVASYASSITQLEESNTTVIFQNNSSAKKSIVSSQKIPETTGGWKVECTLSGTLVADSAGSPDGIISFRLPVLTGNSLSNVFSRIQRSENTVSPISFARSDTGIPQVAPTIAQITDLEAV